MTREEAITILNMVEAHGSLVIQAKDMAIKALEYDDAKYHEEHGEVVVDKAVWEDAKRALEQEPSGDLISRQAVHETIEKWAGSMAVLVALPTREVRPLLDSIHKLPSVNLQPCEDAVSREAVDDILCLYSDGNGMIDAGGAVRMVRELPSVKPQEPQESEDME